MKKCQVCHALASAEAPHCVRCGEASWALSVDAAAPVVAEPVEIAESPATVTLASATGFTHKDPVLIDGVEPTLLVPVPADEGQRAVRRRPR